MSFAQNEKKEKYYTNTTGHWLVEIPIWIPTLRGKFSYGDVDLSSSGTKEERGYEKIDNNLQLEFYFFGRITAQYNKIWIQMEGFSGEVSSAFTYTPVIGSNEKEIFNIKIQETNTRLAIGYELLSIQPETFIKIELKPYLGVRHVRYHIQSDILNSKLLIDKTIKWYQPIIGLYIPIMYKRFKIEMQTDYGVKGLSS